MAETWKELPTGESGKIKYKTFSSLPLEKSSEYVSFVARSL